MPTEVWLCVDVVCCDDEQDDWMDWIENTGGYTSTCGGDGKVSPGIMCTAHNDMKQIIIV